MRVKLIRTHTHTHTHWLCYSGRLVIRFQVTIYTLGHPLPDRLCCRGSTDCGNGGDGGGDCNGDCDGIICDCGW